MRKSDPRKVMVRFLRRYRERKSVKAAEALAGLLLTV
jgi:hypothetical protein